MNKNDFNRFIGGGLVPGGADLEGARELTGLFPWFHSAHLVLLRGLRESSDIKFESQLKGSALYVADRSMLYKYLFMNVPESVEAVAAAGAAPDGMTPEAVVEIQETPETVIEAPEIPETIVEFPEVPVTPETVVETPETPETPETVAEIPVVPEMVETPELLIESPVREEYVESETPEAETGIDEESAQEELLQEDRHSDGTALKTRDELIAEIEARLEEIGGEELLELAEGDEISIESGEESEVDQEKSSEIDSQGAAISEDVSEEVIHSESPAAETSPAVPASGETAAEDFAAEVTASEVPAFEESASEEFIAEVAAAEVTASEKPPEQLSANDLIDRFIRTSPRIERMIPGEVALLQDLTENRTEEHTPFITETLARIYVNQGYYTRAINIYEKLTLQFPEKSTYFASRIEKIKELIK